MGAPAKREATYADLFDIPDHMIGEIINGELHSMPRPSPKHAMVVSSLGGEIVNPFSKGRGGPGGWIILFEPELLMGKNILVPDLAGWKKERLPNLPETNWIGVSPDWVCEVLSPSTVQIDKTKKMPIYANHNVRHVWLIDPIAKTLDVFKRLHGGGWELMGSFAENDSVMAEPFHEIEINLAGLWGV
jgi:Uma2 family endonuclease